LAEKTAASFEAEDVPGLAVAVVRAGGGKCSRCWMYHEETGANADYPETCPRCAAVLGAN
ncbi:MAG: hypothetical protein FWC60_08545, partial [Firmicutes bacterium]|nr:hypothetical protein [Bacillota bacterium]